MIEQVHNTLFAGQAVALQAIHGLGGVGKTQLAVEYAHCHSADYDVVWWIRSEETATLSGDYAALATKLDLPERNAKEQPVIVEAVRRRLEGSERWLLIFDNARKAEELRGYLPAGGKGHVLITSRNPNWRGVAQSLSVRELERQDAIDFLLKRTGQGDRAAAEALADELGNLPLALEQAGAYIEQTGKPLADYLKLYQNRWRELWERGKPADYPDTVATTWQISFQEVRREAPAGVALLDLCSFLAPDYIPLEMLVAGADCLPEPLASVLADELAFDDVIAALRHYSLIEKTGVALSVHRLVQAVVRDWMKEDEQRQWADAALGLLIQLFPEESKVQRDWAVCEKLVPHVMAATGQAVRRETGLSEALILLNNSGLYLLNRAKFVEAKEVLTVALTTGEAVYGQHSHELVPIINNLGGALRELEDFAEARACFERAYKLEEGFYGREHPALAKSLGNLGIALSDQGYLEGGLKLLKRASKRYEAAGEAGTIDAAIVLGSIGGILIRLGKRYEAKNYLERSLEAFEGVSNDSRPELAMLLNNLGRLLEDRNDLTGARSHIERALAIGEAAYGSNHPKVAIFLTRLYPFWIFEKVTAGRVSCERNLRQKRSFRCRHCLPNC
ncbi:MAG TPA: FxSxx-COOH system tetratricopeptide repeat protein [Blastocatellia bacterium]|nr:FxSxx-COOH system tetratricopeptide repeat protein [Blastocatellia bacterium]